MTTIADTVYVVTRVTARNVWLNDKHGGSVRVSRHIIEHAQYHTHTVRFTSYLSGPFERINEASPERNAQWIAARGTDRQLRELQFSLARQSIAELSAAK